MNIYKGFVIGSLCGIYLLVLNTYYIVRDTNDVLRNATPVVQTSTSIDCVELDTTEKYIACLEDQYRNE